MYAYRVLGLPTHGVAAAHLANLVSVGALAVGMLTLVVLTVRRRLDPIAAAGAAVAILLLTNKVYSPTYDLWLVPFFVLLPIARFPGLIWLIVAGFRLPHRRPGRDRGHEHQSAPVHQVLA